MSKSLNVHEETSFTGKPIFLDFFIVLNSVLVGASLARIDKASVS